MTGRYLEQIHGRRQIVSALLVLRFNSHRLGSHLQGAYAEQRPQPSKNTIQKSKNTNNLWFERSQHELGSPANMTRRFARVDPDVTASTCPTPTPLVRKIGRASDYHLHHGEILGHTYAAVVAGSASRVGGGFANPPDTASMQRLRASLSEDT